MSIEVSHSDNPGTTFISDGEDRTAHHYVVTEHNIEICLYEDGTVSSVYIDWTGVGEGEQLPGTYLCKPSATDEEDDR